MSRVKRLYKHFVVSSLVKVCVFASINVTGIYAGDKPQAPAISVKSANPEVHSHETLSTAIRRELLKLPYYGVFDWLEAEVHPDGSVVLRGDVLRPSTKKDAEYRVRRIENVTAIRNEISVAPLFPSDDALRIALYRTIYDWNSPLFRYGVGAMPGIHIVVNNGRASLRGVVASQFDSQFAYAAARQVPGLFEVRNDLRIGQ
jgi:hyperosmotically inducible periplasmic protein